MAKKLAELGADKRRDPPQGRAPARIGRVTIGGRPAPSQVAVAEPVPERSKETAHYEANLNFRVSTEFRRRFRGYAASHDLKLNEVLIRAFDALVKTTK